MVRWLVLGVAALTAAGCVRYTGAAQSADARRDAPDAQPPAETTADRSSVADALAASRPVDGPHAVHGEGVIFVDSAPDSEPADSVLPDGVLPDGVIAWCEDWKNWSCASSGPISCSAACGSFAIICASDRSCSCNGSACGSYGGTACMVCAAALVGGCCGVF